jgi:hypothetical protein
VRHLILQVLAETRAILDIKRIHPERVSRVLKVTLELVLRGTRQNVLLVDVGHMIPMHHMRCLTQQVFVETYVVSDFRKMHPERVSRVQLFKVTPEHLPRIHRSVRFRRVRRPPRTHQVRHLMLQVLVETHVSLDIQGIHQERVSHVPQLNVEVLQEALLSMMQFY